MLKQNITAGIGDPYWYEWSVGLIKIIDMLNPDTGIASVTLQSSEVSGWDDVIVRYNSDRVEYYQIKHSRTEDSLTFGDLVTNTGGKSLLSYLAECWLKISDKEDAKFIIFTNRKIGTRKSSRSTVERPPLKQFYETIKNQVNQINGINEIEIPDNYLQAYQDEWENELIVLNNDEKLRFYRQLDIESDQSSLEEIELDLISKLSDQFGISSLLAEDVLKSLDHALRKWTTTSRNRVEKITIEEVYEKLQKPSAEYVGDHNINPPDPFFESRSKVIDELRYEVNSSNKVIFLSGKPGVGKTSIISQLWNQRDSDIHLRYYTFKPISPENDLLPADAGKTTEAESLWGDLLSQLRGLFKGKLSKYKVPIRNDFLLSVGKLREEVLRLSVELANITQKKTVICIDGIDHAARSEVDNGNYLSTLIPPDNIPEQIVFLICGQSSEAYDRYPIWLRQENENVRKIEIPNLDENDITQLINHHRLQHDSGPISKLIMEFTEGNTLSVMYALETLKKSENLLLAREEFEKNKLKDGLNIYYGSIWEKCRSMIDYSPSLPLQITCIFSLSAARFNVKNFNFILPEYSEGDWSSLLNKLSPIIVEDESGYRVLHNDVKVFFTKLVSRGCEHIYPAVASKLIDLYLSEERFVRQRHDELMKLLIKSNDTNRILEILSPRFVLEAFIVRSRESTLIEHIKLGLDEAIKKQSIEDLQNISCCIKSLNQLFNSNLETDSKWTIHDIDQIHLFELKVKPPVDWDLILLEDVFDFTLDLLHSGHKERAVRLLNRWFHDTTISEIIGILQLDVKDSLDVGSPDRGIMTLFEDYGRIFYHTRIWLIKFDLDNELVKTLLANITTGILEEYQVAEGHESILELISIHPRVYYPKDYKNLILFLIDRERWIDLYSFLARIEISSLDDYSKLYAMFISLRSNDAKLISKWVTPTKDRIFEILKDEDYGEQYRIKIEKVVIISFIHAYLNISVDPSVVTSQIVKELPAKIDLDNELLKYTNIFYISIQLSRWFYEIQVDGKTENFSFMDITRMKELTNHLLVLDDDRPSYTYFEIDTSMIFLIKTLIYCVEKSSEDYSSKLTEIIKEYCSKHPGYNNYFEIFWNYCDRRNIDEYCSLMLSSSIGEEGQFWSCNNFEKQKIVNNLLELTKGTKYQPEVESIAEKLKWFQIGFSTHKDYNLYDELEWLKPVLRNNPELYKSLGIRLLALSNIVTDTGDNRADYAVHKILMNSAMRSSLRDGYEFYLILKNNSRVYRGFLIDSLLDYASDFTKNEKELKYFWLIGCGLTYNHAHEDKKVIYNIKNKIRSNSLIKPEIIDFMQETNNIDFNIEKLSEVKDDYAAKEPIPILNDPFEILQEYIENNGEDWRYLKRIINSALESNPGRANEVVRKAYSYVMKSFSNVVLGYGGVKEIFNFLIPRISINERWTLANRLLEVIYDKEDEWNFHTIAKILEELCLALSQNDLYLLERGFNSIVKMHEDWITGFGNYVVRGEEVILFGLTDRLAINNLENFYLQILLEKLDSRSAIQIERALSAIWHFIKLQPSLLTYIRDQWDSLSADQQEYLLMLFELVPIHLKSDFDKILPILDTVYKAGILSHKLQVLLVYMAHARVDGSIIPPFICNSSANLLKKGELIYPYTTILKSLEGFSNTTEHLITTHHHLFQRRIEFLGNSKIIFSEVDLLEKLSYLSSLNQLAEDKPPRSELEPDFIIGSRSMDDNFNEVIEHELSESDIDLSIFPSTVQALMCNDDPQKFEYGFRNSIEMIDWSLLEKPVSKPDILISELLSFGLSSVEVVIGGYIQIFTREINLKGSLNTYFIVDEKVPVFVESSTYNSRTVFLYEQNRNRSIGNSLFSIAGGISKLIGQSNYYIPSSELLELSSWEVDEISPFKLNKDGYEVARMEQLMGPLDYLNNNPAKLTYLQRWVCSKEAFDELNTIVKTRSSVKVVEYQKKK